MNDAHDAADSDAGGSATDADSTNIIVRYMTGSDSEREEFAALLADELARRAQRTWTAIGAQYTTPKRRPDILRAIASLEWQKIGGASVQVPAAPGLAIQACIRELRLPNADQIAWHGSASTVDWHDEHEPEGQHYAIYGIQARYQNGRARLYVIDVGTQTVPLASDFWPTAAPVQAPVASVDEPTTEG